MGLLEELDKKSLEIDKCQKRGQGKAFFLGQLNEIKQALDKGYTMKFVWQHLHDNDKMPVTYASFTNYVYKFIISRKGMEKSNPKIRKIPRTDVRDEDIHTKTKKIVGNSKPIIPGVPDKKGFSHKKKPDESLLVETITEDKKNRLPRGYNNAPKTTTFMDDGDDMPSIYDSSDDEKDEGKPLKNDNNRDEEKKEHIPRGLGTSSSIRALRKGHIEEEYPESDIFKKYDRTN